MAVVFSCQLKMGIISIYVSGKNLFWGLQILMDRGAYLGGPNISEGKWTRGPYLGGSKFVNDKFGHDRTPSNPAPYCKRPLR